MVLLPIDGIAGSIFDISIPIITINATSTPYVQNDIGLISFFPLNTPGFNMDLLTGGEIPITKILVFPITPRVCIHFCTIKTVNKWVKKTKS
ncbi:MAG: hypothetical protein ACFFB5_13910 [Promethearchaeota archaeon]